MATGARGRSVRIAALPAYPRPADGEPESAMSSMPFPARVAIAFLGIAKDDHSAAPLLGLALPHRY
jgi:hypothetical protein